MAVLGLHCCSQAFSSWGAQWLVLLQSPSVWGPGSSHWAIASQGGCRGRAPRALMLPGDPPTHLPCLVLSWYFIKQVFLNLPHLQKSPLTAPRVHERQRLHHTGSVALQHVGLPGSGTKPASPALAGRFPTTGPPGKSSILFFNAFIFTFWDNYLFCYYF